ncbi:MAG: ABC transporter permease [Candidatus Nanopelagicales bacterium]
MNAVQAAEKKTARPQRYSSRRSAVLMMLLEARTVIVLILLVAFFSSISSYYLTTGNLLVMAKHVSITAIMAIGMTFVILTAGIDLSVGAVAGLAGMIVGGLLYEGFAFAGVTVWFSVPACLVLGILVGVLCGFINGAVITKLRVAPFIATLGMLYVARGLAALRSDGATFPQLSGTDGRGNQGFLFIGQERILGVPVSVWIMIVVAVAAHVLAKHTVFGRQVYAVGGNERAAALSGVRTDRVKIWVYIISGACAALAGLIITSELGAAYPDTGNTYELNAIAAAVLGGTSLMGGKGTIVGTVIGAFVIGFLADGLTLVGVSAFWQLVIKGSVIVLAVVLEQTQQQLQTRLARR